MRHYIARSSVNWAPWRSSVETLKRFDNSSLKGPSGGGKKVKVVPVLNYLINHFVIEVYEGVKVSSIVFNLGTRWK
jgi:hypothetical protein